MSLASSVKHNQIQALTLSTLVESNWKVITSNSFSKNWSRITIQNLWEQILIFLSIVIRIKTETGILNMNNLISF